MSTFLLCWNPKYWDWPELREAKAFVDIGGFVEQRWSCGTKQVRIGDRLFLIRLGTEPKGIMASGAAISEPFMEEHWDGSGRTRRYLHWQVDALLDADAEPILPLARLKAEPAFQPMNWSARQSGVRVPDEVAAGVERAWAPFAAPENSTPETTTDGAEDDD